MLSIKYNFLDKTDIDFISQYQGLSIGQARNDNNLNHILKIINLIKNEIMQSQTKENIYLENFGIKTNGSGEHVSLHYDLNGITEGRREFAAHLYLNNEFDGGEISYPNQNFCEKPQKNLLITFPTTDEYPHEMKLINSGTRSCMIVHFTRNKNLAYANSLFNLD